MLTLSHIVAVLALFLELSWAGLINSDIHTLNYDYQVGHKKEICYTKRGPLPHVGPVPTVYHTHKHRCTSTIVAVTTTTSTPSPVTSTVVTSTTETSTAGTSVSTATDITTTVVSTDATTTTTTTTTSFTVIGTVATSTQPTPDGFLPVPSTLPGATYDTSDGEGFPPAQRRSLDPLKPILHGAEKSVEDLLKFPQKVNCHKWRNHKCKHKTVTITSTSVAPPPTSTTTSTVTYTSTITPSAATTTTTTVSFTSTTSTSTSTSIETVDSTTEVATSTSTIYQVCQTPNVANVVGARHFTIPEDPSGVDTVFTDVTTSPYDCCVSALSIPDGPPLGFDLYLPGGGTSRYCGVSYALQSTCPHSQYIYKLTIDTSATGEERGYIGNLPCGAYFKTRDL